ncbi:hypothetical protein GCM10009716_22740 [Streptomyces sodiiphilus]|uniref:Peptidase S1 domain-containing protein n=1 Tax=Streptomyces sodiiphilus TaxID=226217 RepID=A0ABP5AHU2_9ACTN
MLHSGSGHRCTLGFNATDGARHFGILPGFCGAPGTTWFADPERRIPVGTTTRSWFPTRNYSLITYTNTSLTYPSEVNADGRVVRIEDAREPASSTRICHVGGATGHRCGALLGPGIPPVDPDHDFRSDICSEPGDAGGPAFQGSSAVGIIVGGSGTCATGGTTSYLRITPVLSMAGLRVGH